MHVDPCELNVPFVLSPLPRCCRERAVDFGLMQTDPRC